MKLIHTPNLPENRISLAAVGNYPEIITALNGLGIRTVSLENTALSPDVARHQDMLLCHTGDEGIFLDPSQDKTLLEKEGFKVFFSEVLRGTYPHDVKLNCAVSEDFFICNPKTLNKALYEALISSGKTPFHVNQGYTKCSVCFVTEKAIITEDPSIYEALSKTDIDVLLISKGDIYLSHSHYGFFGGSTGKIDKHTLAVTGNLSYHRDGKTIKEFCKKHGVDILELTQNRIIDLGGIIPLIS